MEWCFICIFNKSLKLVVMTYIRIVCFFCIVVQLIDSLQKNLWAKKLEDTDRSLTAHTSLGDLSSIYALWPCNWKNWLPISFCSAQPRKSVDFQLLSVMTFLKAENSEYKHCRPVWGAQRNRSFVMKLSWILVLVLTHASCTISW